MPGIMLSTLPILAYLILKAPIVSQGSNHFCFTDDIPDVQKGSLFTSYPELLTV